MQDFVHQQYERENRELSKPDSGLHQHSQELAVKLASDRGLR